MGKTALALKVASHVAVQEKKPVIIFSLDMSKEQVTERLLCSEARIDQQAVRQRMLDESDYQRIVYAAQRLYDAPIFIDDSASIRVLELRARARRMASDQGQLGLVIVDYLQLVDGGGRFDNRVQEYRPGVALAEEPGPRATHPGDRLRAVGAAPSRCAGRRACLYSPTCAKAAPSRPRPMLVMFIYLLMYYGEEEFRRWAEESGRPAEYGIDQGGIAEIIVAKQRNGPTGTVSLAWVDRCATFEELAHYEEE